MKSTHLVLLFVAAIGVAPGCGSPRPGLYGETPDLESTGGGGGGGADGGAGGGKDGGGGGKDGGSGKPPSCDNIVGDRKTQVCLRWNCDRRDRAEDPISGDPSSCEEGKPSVATIRNTLKMVNLYRFIADLPPVENDEDRGAKAQQCSMMMAANRSLSHNPPRSWKCWTAGGAEAASRSNIATSAAVPAIDMYMQDFGANNAHTIGHRRWLLSNSLGPVGIGTANNGSCIWVIEGQGNAGREWTAWPPPGPVPLGAWQPGFGDGIDVTGWTIQSDTIDLDEGQVRVTRDGKDELDGDTMVLGANYGSRSAIKFLPDGWTAQAGHTYHVSVAGVAATIEYDVQPQACP